MGCRLNRLDEPVYIALSKPLLTEFGIHPRLESCVLHTEQKVSKIKDLFDLDYFKACPNTSEKSMHFLNRPKHSNLSCLIF